MPFLAKSRPKANGEDISLEEHTQNVVSEVRKVLAHHTFVADKYARLTAGKSIEARTVNAAEYHDEGKKCPKWQNACQADNLIYKQTGKDGRNLLKTGVRHEIESIKMLPDLLLADPVKISILAHHGKLGQHKHKQWEEDEKAQKIWAWVQNTKVDAIPEGVDKLKAAVQKNYEFAGVRSYLQLADHRASIVEGNNTVPAFTPFSYSFQHSKKRPVQELVEHHWQDRLLLLRAPTGSGKTDACLIWAAKQIKDNRADRLVIAMPTRFTSNALAIGVNESVELGNTGLYHSSAWFKQFHEKAKLSRKDEHEAKTLHEFARLLETPITVCTIDHLLIAQTHSKEDHHGITFNLAHSCVVIDEADFYDDFTQSNIFELLRVLNILDVPVLLMSASLPEASLKIYQRTGYDVQAIREDTSDLKRVRCRVEAIQEYESLSDIESLLERALDEPTIIYANTVARAMEFYTWFEKRMPADDVILYHSRFTEPDKVGIEDDLLQRLGRKAWENGTAKGVAILTQIGEMSVNISARLMISELCPMDRLVQRAGRLTRFQPDNFQPEVGRLFVLKPQKKDALYPAPYGMYQQGKGWIPFAALLETEKQLECKNYNAKEFVRLINLIYANSDLAEIPNQAEYRRLIKHNWLTLPAEEAKEDDGTNQDWRSRNILGQTEIFVRDPLEYIKENPQRKLLSEHERGVYFSSYREFQAYKNQYVVNYPSYLIAKGKDKGRLYIREVWIGDYQKDPLKIWCSDTSCYNNQDRRIGLDVVSDDDNTL